MKKIAIEVNGKKVSKEIQDHTTLSGLLRDILNLTGTHIGCDTRQSFLSPCQQSILAYYAN